jgi:hypothetical protein
VGTGKTYTWKEQGLPLKTNESRHHKKPKKDFKLSKSLSLIPKWDDRPPKESKEEDFPS